MAVDCAIVLALALALALGEPMRVGLSILGAVALNAELPSATGPDVVWAADPHHFGAILD